jgi:type III secretion protein Q
MTALRLRRADAAISALQQGISAWRRRGMTLRLHSPDAADVKASSFVKAPPFGPPPKGPQPDARYIAFHAGDVGGGWNGLIQCDEWLTAVAPGLAALAIPDGCAELALQLFAATPQPLTAMAVFPYDTITATGLVSGWDLQKSSLAALITPAATLWLRALPAAPANGQENTQAITAWTHGIPATLQFLLGASRLSSGCLSRVGPGDVLLVTDHALRMRCNDQVLGWYSITDKGITVDDLLKQPYEDIAEASLQAEPEEAGIGSGIGNSANASANAGNAAQTTQTARAGVARIPVRLEFVLQQNRMTVGQLGQLHRGQVVALDTDAEKSILVLANGALLGRGELVQLEDRLGVEMIELYGGDHAD